MCRNKVKSKYAFIKLRNQCKMYFVSRYDIDTVKEVEGPMQRLYYWPSEKNCLALACCFCWTFLPRLAINRKNHFSFSIILPHFLLSWIQMELRTHFGLMFSLEMHCNKPYVQLKQLNTVQVISRETSSAHNRIKDTTNIVIKISVACTFVFLTRLW